MELSLTFGDKRLSASAKLCPSTTILCCSDPFLFVDWTVFYDEGITMTFTSFPEFVFCFGEIPHLRRCSNSLCADNPVDIIRYPSYLLRLERPQAGRCAILTSYRVVVDVAVCFLTSFWGGISMTCCPWAWVYVVFVLLLIPVSTYEGLIPASIQNVALWPMSPGPKSFCLEYKIIHSHSKDRNSLKSFVKD